MLSLKHKDFIFYKHFVQTSHSKPDSIAVWFKSTCFRKKKALCDFFEFGDF